MIRSLRRILYLSLLVVMLTACVTGGQQWDPSDYTVNSGDTLYSIAWRYELDPDDLARWNHLGDNSVIHPGERLHTRGPVAASGPSQAEPIEPSATETPAAISTTVSPAVIVVKRGDTLYALARKHHLDIKQLIQANRLKRPYQMHPGQKLYTQIQHASSHAAAPSSIALPEPRNSYPDVVRWSWPLQGKIISGFNRNSEPKGIDIAGHEGEEVHAAAAGKVVYSGNGLISFGNLVIIKHNDTFLSAYAYNRTILVTEGQRVSRGQVIAKIGKTDIKNSVLHFEIRKHGKPVNPLHYLPHS